LPINHLLCENPQTAGRIGQDGLGEIRLRFPDLPVMIVTAYGDDERRRQASEDGAAALFTKPVDFDHLKAQLRQLPSAPH
jgi:CheY-like chemotaxis protein